MMKIKETLKIAGKYIDQPLLINKIKKAVPYGLCTLGAGYVGYDTYYSSKEQRKLNFVKNSMIMTGTIASALAAPKFAAKIFRNGAKAPAKSDIISRNRSLVDNFLKSRLFNEKEKQILNKAKEKLLSFSDIKFLYKKGEQDKQTKQFLNKLIPEPEAPTSHDIFTEIGWLSLLGFIPVAGGGSKRLHCRCCDKRQLEK